MDASSQIIKTMLEQYEFTVSEYNVDRSVERLMLTNQPLAQLVTKKCNQLMDGFQLPEATRIVGSSAIKAIINVLEEPLEELDDMDFNYFAPCAHTYEDDLYHAFLNAKDSLLTRCWNDSTVYEGWQYVADNNELRQFMPEKTGWFVRGEEKISVSVAIRAMVLSYLAEIERWINYFTKTLFVNTTTEEWAEVYGVDLSDKQAVKDMKEQLRKSLLGE